MPRAGLSIKKESKEEVEKRILEAEKVVVSSFLHQWRKKYGMDYIIVVRNSPEEVFARFRVSDKNKPQLREAAEELVRFFWGDEGVKRLNEFEREMEENPLG